MLTLTRQCKRGKDSIILRDRDTGLEVKIVLIKLQRGAAHIGIQAPSNVLILREEIADQAPREKP